MGVAGSRTRAAVLGHPIAHSLSPVLHGAAYRHLDLDWTYEAWDVTTEQLPAVVGGLDATWAGLSLTMPLKEAILPLLTTVDPIAEQLRSVNTVVLDGKHRRGTNTDVPGLASVLRDLDPNPGASVALIGAGATARSATAALQRVGVGSVTVCARRPAAARDIKQLGELLGQPITVIDWSLLPHVLTADVVLSTVPVAGSAAVAIAVEQVFDQVGRDDQGSDLAPVRSPGCLIDVIYQQWPTPLALAWQGAGGSVTGGLDLLVYQAAEQVRLMTGHEVPAEVLRTAGVAELERRKIAQADQ